MNGPLVVNTRDGSVWTRRAVTAAGVSLYALAGVCSCPEYVMASFEELAARGIVGSAAVLPVPVGSGPRTLDVVEEELTGANLSLWEEEQDHARTRLALESARRGRRELRARVAELEGQRTALAVRLRAGQRWQKGRTPALVSQDYVPQNELRSLFGLPLTAPWDEESSAAEASADALTAMLAPTQALTTDETGGAS